MAFEKLSEVETYYVGAFQVVAGIASAAISSRYLGRVVSWQSAAVFSLAAAIGDVFARAASENTYLQLAGLPAGAVAGFYAQRLLFPNNSFCAKTAAVIGAVLFVIRLLSLIETPAPSGQPNPNDKKTAGTST